MQQTIRDFRDAIMTALRHFEFCGATVEAQVELSEHYQAIALAIIAERNLRTFGDVQRLDLNLPLLEHSRQLYAEFREWLEKRGIEPTAVEVPIPTRLM